MPKSIKRNNKEEENTKVTMEEEFEDDDDMFDEDEDFDTAEEYADDDFEDEDFEDDDLDDDFEDEEEEKPVKKTSTKKTVKKTEEVEDDFDDDFDDDDLDDDDDFEEEGIEEKPVAKKTVKKAAPKKEEASEDDDEEVEDKAPAKKTSKKTTAKSDNKKATKKTAPKKEVTEKKETKLTAEAVFDKISSKVEKSESGKPVTSYKMTHKEEIAILHDLLNENEDFLDAIGKDEISVEDTEVIREAITNICIDIFKAGGGFTIAKTEDYHLTLVGRYTEPKVWNNLTHADPCRVGEFLKIFASSPAPDNVKTIGSIKNGKFVPNKKQASKKSK